jgi:glycosyltransferase involved in cell wall biosynthesis
MPSNSRPNPNYLYLNNTLVLTVKKSFWASQECEIFPHRIFTRKLFYGPGKWGSQSRNPINNLTVILQGLSHVLRHKTRLLIIGSATRAPAWFARFKKAGLIPHTRILITTQSYVSDELAHYVDKIIIYSRTETHLHHPGLKDKYVFMVLPADGDFEALSPGSDSYIFAGGGAGRDFPSLIEAVRGTSIPLRIITFSPNTLNYSKALPDNCQVVWRIPVQSYLEHMSRACFVVNPLQPGLNSHGQTTIVQALRLGKAVISTQDASVDDYIQDRKVGLLVEPGDILGYRHAITRLYADASLRQNFEAQAGIFSRELTYAAFARNLTCVCREMLA